MDGSGTDRICRHRLELGSMIVGNRELGDVARVEACVAGAMYLLMLLGVE